MISRTGSSPEMILLLNGFAKAAVSAPNKIKPTRHRSASIFMIEQINTFLVSATEIRRCSVPIEISWRDRCRRTTRCLVQFQQRAFIQRDKATPRRINVRNQGDNDGHEHWKNKSLKN